MKKLFLTLLFVFASATCARADEIALWNFNDSDLVVDRGSGTIESNFNPANITFSSGTSVNAQMGDVAGQALVLAGGTSLQNNGANITLRVSTVGFGSIVVSFATQRTSTGFNSNQFQYSTDGVTFLDFGSPYDPPASFGVQLFDLSSITALNNNALAAFRIVFNGASGATGNNRLDNLLVSGTTQPTAEPVPEPATMLLFGTGLAGVACTIRRRRKTA